MRGRRRGAGLGDEWRDCFSVVWENRIPRLRESDERTRVLSPEVNIFWVILYINEKNGKERKKAIKTEIQKMYISFMKGEARLRELAPAARGSQDARSRNLFIPIME